MRQGSKVNTDDCLLNSVETAQLLGLKNPQTLAVWRNTKRHPDLPYIKVGGAVRYSKQAINEFIAKHSVGVSRADPQVRK